MRVGGDEYRADAVIVATRASARQLGLSSEEKASRSRRLVLRDVRRRLLPDRSSWSRAAATPRWRRRPSWRARSVVIVHRRDEFRASPIMVDQARANEKIEFGLERGRRGARRGERSGHGRRLRDTLTGELRDIDADGLFVAIGHDPTTALFLDWLDHDEQGLVTDPRSTRTNVEGSSPPATCRIHLPPGRDRRRLQDDGRARRTALARATPPAGSRGGFRLNDSSDSTAPVVTLRAV